MKAPAMWRGLRYRYRLMAAMLVVSLPMMVVLATILTANASSSLTDAAQQKGVSVSRAVALRLEDWLSERRENLIVIAETSASGRLSTQETTAELAKLDKTYNDYSLLEITDRTGEATATSRPGVTIAAAGQAWFRAAVTGHQVVTSPVLRSGRIQWIMAEPIRGDGGRVEGVAIANLDPVILAELLNSIQAIRSSRSIRNIASSTTRRWARSPTTRPYSQPER